MKTIPKRFIRIWLGTKPIPEQFEIWWQGFKDIHEGYEFITLKDDHEIEIPAAIKPIYDSAASYAGRSDILRMLALHQLGGIYLDTDMVALKSFDPLLEDPRLFICLRSSKSFANGVIGCMAGDKAMADCINALPDWYDRHKDRACSVSTGPAFISSVLFGCPDVRHLPIKTFYPYNGFGAPKKEEKDRIFSDPNNFPPEMIAAHYGTHSWGGNPNKKNKN